MPQLSEARARAYRLGDTVYTSNDVSTDSESQASSSSKYPFSTDVPELLQKHLEYLQTSAISIDVIRGRGYKSVLGKTPLKEAGFGKVQQRVPGILIPLHGVDGTVIGFQYRPDKPRLNARGKPIKYENPTGSSVRLDVPPRCREQLGDPSVPICFTEGAKKADSLGVCPSNGWLAAV